ncbi:MAG: M67 family metallopeptidase [Gemmatimonadota bacterium]|nr:M67 family metallopeptidase [Gemmatimonadota bacterium]
MRLIVPETTMRTIRAEAEAGHPHEVCGFLLGSRRGGERVVGEALPAANQRTDSAADRYRIDADAYRAVEREADRSGAEILGFYHSHPDAPARPSEYDREHAWPSVAYLIVSVREGEAGETTAWRLAEDRSDFESIELEIPVEEENRCPTS